MEPNKLIKDKNKLLMAIPVILGILFLYVFFIREDGNCLLYTSDAADEEDSVDLGGRRMTKKKKNNQV